MADGQMAVLPDAGQRARLQPLLQDLQQRVEGVRTVVLASVDCFAPVSRGADGPGGRLEWESVGWGKSVADWYNSARRGRTITRK